MSETPDHQFEFVPAPAPLSPYLNSLYVLKVGKDGLDETLPAYSGQLLLVARGGGEMDFGHGAETAPKNGFFIGPLSSAARFRINGPALIVGASFNFHGWAAIAQSPVAESGDRLIPLAELFGEEAAAELVAITKAVRSGKAETGEALDTLAAVLASKAAPLAPAHIEVIEVTYRWLSSSLNPATDSLYRKLDLSDRQAQRLVKRFFGLPPSRLKRRFRAIRAATLLADHKLDAAIRNEIFDAFYDQAHLIREIREFTGRTPRILTRDDGSVISETLGAQGYGVVNLFGSSEEEQLAGNR